MKLVLLGYGKMGKEIEQVALQRNHEIILKVNSSNMDNISLDKIQKADVAIEFSTPASAVKNIHTCFNASIPVVVGTTGWLDKLNEIKQACIEKNQTLFYSSNYSIGVNIFFKLNEYLAQIMNNHNDYNVSIEEIHHLHKLDSPSGTAISTAKGIIENLERKNVWVNHPTDKKNELEIISQRIDEVPGTHRVSYDSAIDKIEIIHTAHSRKGFALGAVLAAEFTKGKKGVFEMNDLLKL